MKSAQTTAYRPSQRHRQQTEEVRIMGVDVDISGVGIDVDPEDVDASDFAWNSDNELVHRPSGLIVSENRIDRSPEWRGFTHDEHEQKSRCGSPMTETIHDKGLSTNIDWRNKDASGRSISNKKRQQISRLRKWNHRSKSDNPTDRNLKLALTETKRMCSALGVPDSVHEFASVLYRRCLQEDMVRGRSIEGMTSAAIYVSCRQEGIPRSLDEISEVSRVPQLEIARTYKYISQEFDLGMKPVDPKKYVPRFASKLELDNKVQQRAKQIIAEAAEEGLLSGKSPTGFAAAAIYCASLVCEVKKTQAEIAEAANVTEVTIRNRYKEQAEVIGLY